MAQKHKLGTLLVRSNSACWLLFIEILTVCGLTNPDRRTVASSLNTTLAYELVAVFDFRKKDTAECTENSVYRSHTATFGICNAEISNELAQWCVLSTAPRWLFGQFLLLVFLECERTQASEFVWRGFSLYKCNQPRFIIYTMPSWTMICNSLPHSLWNLISTVNHGFRFVILKHT
jgi:hypothetical protein